MMYRSQGIPLSQMKLSTRAACILLRGLEQCIRSSDYSFTAQGRVCILSVHHPGCIAVECTSLQVYTYSCTLLSVYPCCCSVYVHLLQILFLFYTNNHHFSSPHFYIPHLKNLILFCRNYGWFLVPLPFTVFSLREKIAWFLVPLFYRISYLSM